MVFPPKEKFSEKSKKENQSKIGKTKKQKKREKEKGKLGADFFQMKQIMFVIWCFLGAF